MLSSQIFFKHFVTSVVHNCDLMFGKCVWHCPQQSVACSTVTCFTPVCNTLKFKEKTFMCHGMKISKPGSYHCCFDDCLPPSLWLDTFSYQLLQSIRNMVLGLHTWAKLYHKYSRIVGTDLVMGCPIWNCSFSNTCTPQWILMSVGIIRAFQNHAPSIKFSPSILIYLP